ncbi:MAG TPA: (2Fe-2S)-binding protein [Rhizomicrobium sp.]|jgi:bacterioferritin-associated ferredoxin|nr:(2Fe-2S)-binding protein [Rhizomicrobium sp.]
MSLAQRLALMIVCVCNRLNEDRIRTAIDGGACCSDEVYARCGVRKNCGRCQETIDEMLDEKPVREAA